MQPIVLSIAGSDPSGGAGVQADLKAIVASGGYATTAVTAITVQNTAGVLGVEPLPAALVRAQIEAVFADLAVAAVKTGMLASAEIVREVAGALRGRQDVPCVCDPVIRSTSGHVLLPPDGVDALRRELLPLATLVTPNAAEAAALTGVAVRTLRQAEEAGRALLAAGARAVLVKGGHLEESAGTDVLVTPRGAEHFPGTWFDTPHTHGTGCTYSAAIATHIAMGRTLCDAIEAAKAFVSEAIRHGLPLGSGGGPTDPFFFLRTRGAVPGVLQVITDETIQERFSHEELARLAVAGGADAVQFREKRPRTTRELVACARRVRAATGASGARVLVNDRADVAAAAAADGVHLGRDDLDPSLARRMLGGRALVGGTANDLEEALRVAETDVDYLGVGPVFGTRTKARPAPELGLSALREIVSRVSKPVVAIGSITAERVEEVLATGVRGIAVASAVVCAGDPAAATRRLREAIEAFHRAHA